jgi:hypothetical protein
MERLAAVAFIFAGTLHVAGAQTTIVVKLYDPAHLEKHILRDAEDEAAYILRSAGLGTVWINCMSPAICPDPPLVSDVFVRLAPNSVFPKENTSPATALGRAVTGFGRSADYVEVFCAPIQKLAKETETASTADLIGAVMAHEIGHLFLGPQHTRYGLMSACWSLHELALIARRKLKFNEVEKAELKRQILARGALQRKEVAPELSRLVKR